MGQTERSVEKYKSNNIICFRCGRDHLAPKCTLPKDVKCAGCSGYGHLKRVCKKAASANAVDEVLKVEGTIQNFEHTEFRRRYRVSLIVEGKPFKFEVDSDAVVSLVSQNFIEHEFPNLPLKKTHLGLRTYCKANLSPRGYVKVKDSKGFKNLNLYIVNVDREPLLEREWINQLQKLNNLRIS